MTSKPEYLLTNKPDTYNNPAIVSSQLTISYRQLFNAVELCAERLIKLGIHVDERVGIVSPNSIEYIIALISLWSIKAVACPFNVRLPELTLKHQMQLINCQYLLTSEETNTLSQIKQTRLSSIVTDEDFKTHHTPKTESEYGLNISIEQKATILFTSGSESNPKAVLHSIGNHIYSAKGSNALIPVFPCDHWLLSLPLYHVSGLSILFRVLREGGIIVVPGPRENITHVLEHNAITHISLVPTQLARLCADEKIKFKLQNFKAILIGGSIIPNTLLQNSLKNKLPVYTTYGLTEMASQVATAQYPMPVQPLNYCDVKISNDGEILVKGETLFQGYIEGDTIHLPLTKDGWFATGDLGSLQEKEGLIVTGRKDNMFISGGENIQPEEIEQFLRQLESIEQAVVVPVQNDEFGFRPVAFIKQVGESSLKTEKLCRFLENHLPKFKIPDHFYAWPDDADSSSLKINRPYFTQLALKNNISVK